MVNVLGTESERHRALPDWELAPAFWCLIRSRFAAWQKQGFKDWNVGIYCGFCS